MPDTPFILLEDDRAARTLLFRAPRAILRADSQDEIDGILAAITEATRAGHHVAGFASFEAGYRFEARLRPQAPASPGPLLCFGVFDPPEVLSLETVEEGGWLTPLEPDWTADDYRRRFDQVAQYIRAGDVYQVNLTFPLRGTWAGDPLSLYAKLRRHQPPRHGGVVALGGPTILSFSPELFLEAEDRGIRVRPMKGTAPRGATRAEDDALAEQLAASAKDRAENLMIVDLLRNDLSRVSEVGSVVVTDLFSIERYPTVLQMTSGIAARLRPGIGLPDLFAALFPCGSVTGAPKIRAIEIIRELEDGPRGVYCGSIGHIRPDGSARFNVAIRTATLSPDGSAVFNVGSGVVFDSVAQAEYEECLLKARFLQRATRASA